MENIVVYPTSYRYLLQGIRDKNTFYRKAQQTMSQRSVRSFLNSTLTGLACAGLHQSANFMIITLFVEPGLLLTVGTDVEF